MKYGTKSKYHIKPLYIYKCKVAGTLYTCTYLLATRTIVSLLLSPETATITQSRAEGNSCCLAINKYFIIPKKI